MDPGGPVPARGAAALLALLLVGCGVPVQVRPEEPAAVHRQLTRSALSAGEPSEASLNVLYRWELADTYDDDPAAALSALHQVVADGRGTGNEVFALAELSFLHAQDGGGRRAYLAAAVYAYAFLFPNGADQPPSRFDPRVRVASDLYNRALTSAFEDDAGRYELPAGGSFPLPFGMLDVTFDPSQLRWGDRVMVDFVPTAELAVTGLRQRYRWPGVGAPLAAGTVRAADDSPGSGFDIVSPEAHVPVTALLRMPDARREIVDGYVRGTLELHAATDTTSVEIDGGVVPLEVESTSSLAYTLAGSEMWDWELKGFFIGDLLAKQPSQLVAMQPYRRGRFPVVLVHGTASSPARWADLVNDLANDTRLRDCFQFWYYSYDTGNPVTYSAAGLRDALRAAVAAYDPLDQDPTMRRMVVIGHSQGGLLTKLTAVDTGTRLYDSMFRRPVDQLVVSDRTRAFLTKTLFVTPLPFVTRVVFISTPHRGSYLAGNWLAQYVASFVSLPQDLVTNTAELVTGNPGALFFTSVDDVRGSVHDMTPGNAFVRSLSAIPVAPGIASHSIIPVTGDPPPDGQNDGVVEYASASIQPVDSEYVIFEAAHSVQGDPKAVEEVRRILLVHAEEARAQGVACGGGERVRP
jgi:pimeloyl-ACP methyl ester carboxylesterase